MRLFDDLSRVILGALFNKPNPNQNNPAEDRESRPSRGPRQTEVQPYYLGEVGINPPSTPASRPYSPKASRQPSRPSSAPTSRQPSRTPSAPTSHQPSARTPSATTLPTPSAPTSHQPSARTPSATTSRPRSVSPASKIASPRKKGIFEVIKDYVIRENKKIHAKPIKGEINKEVDELVEKMRNLIKIEETIAIYKEDAEKYKRLRMEKPEQGIKYDGLDIKEADVRYFYTTKDQLETLYQFLNENGITEFNLRDRRDSYKKATMKEEKNNNNMRNKSSGPSVISGGGRGP
jgi:hypothetical protein